MINIPFFTGRLDSRAWSAHYFNYITYLGLAIPDNEIDVLRCIESVANNERLSYSNSNAQFVVRIRIRNHVR